MMNTSTKAVLAKKFLQSRGVSVKHSDMLELIAILAGFKNYQTYQAAELAAQSECVPALSRAPQGSENDFLMHPSHISAWVEVDNQAVYIARTDEGLVVDIYSLGSTDEPLASTYCFTQECVDNQVETIREFDSNMDSSDMQRVVRLCKLAGIEVQEDSDQPGLWLYQLKNQSNRVFGGSDISFTSEQEAWLSAYEEHYAQQIRHFTAKALGR